jgi:hypothetical protein
MSLLRSTYLEILPDRDRLGRPDVYDNTVEVHVAATGWHHVHIALQSGNDEVEVNLTIENALQIVAALSAAVALAMKGLPDEN